MIDTLIYIRLNGTNFWSGMYHENIRNSQDEGNGPRLRKFTEGRYVALAKLTPEEALEQKQNTEPTKLPEGILESNEDNRKWRDAIVKFNEWLVKTKPNSPILTKEDEEIPIAIRKLPVKWKLSKFKKQDIQDPYDWVFDPIQQRYVLRSSIK